MGRDEGKIATGRFRSEHHHSAIEACSSFFDGKGTEL